MEQGLLYKHVSSHFLCFYVHNPESYAHATTLDIYSIFMCINAWESVHIIPIITTNNDVTFSIHCAHGLERKAKENEPTVNICLFACAAIGLCVCMYIANVTLCTGAL